MLVRQKEYQYRLFRIEGLTSWRQSGIFSDQLSWAVPAGSWGPRLLQVLGFQSSKMSMADPDMVVWLRARFGWSDDVIGTLTVEQQIELSQQKIDAEKMQHQAAAGSMKLEEGK